MKLFWALLIVMGFRVADAKLATELQAPADDPPLQGRVRVIRSPAKRRVVRPYRKVDAVSDDSIL